jgi:hypothetical protein
VKILKFLFTGDAVPDNIIEGKYAHEYTDPDTRNEIANSYTKRYTPSPLSHPDQFDPLNPPPGWVYDPFYETWIKT